MPGASSGPQPALIPYLRQAQGPGMRQCPGTLLAIEDGRAVWSDERRDCDDLLATRYIAGPRSCAAVVCLDDDRAVGSLTARVLMRVSRGRLAVYHCLRPEPFRRLITHLARENEPLVAVTSDQVHPGPSLGPEDLRFVNEAPMKVAFAGVQARALPLALISSWEVGRHGAADPNWGFLPKPWRPDDLLGLLCAGLIELRDTLSADLLSPGDVIRGSAGWGPRSEVQAALERLQLVTSAMMKPKRRRRTRARD